MIVRGATQNIKWRFHKINVSDITEATMSISQDYGKRVTKSLEDMVVDTESNMIIVPLTVEDTTSVTEIMSNIRVQLKYKTDTMTKLSKIYFQSPYGAEPGVGIGNGIEDEDKGNEFIDKNNDGNIEII